jgi:hypothetical protein
MPTVIMVDSTALPVVSASAEFLVMGYLMRRNVPLMPGSLGNRHPGRGTAG